MVREGVPLNGSLEGSLEGSWHAEFWILESDRRGRICFYYNIHVSVTPTVGCPSLVRDYYTWSAGFCRVLGCELCRAG